VIIGGGVAGIASAYELCEKGHNVILLEKYEDTGQQCSAAPAGKQISENVLVDNK
jgi:glycine/D-amino acid oxidase-like deaminating enzyme